MKRIISVLVLLSFLFTVPAYASSPTTDPKPPHLFMDIPFHLTQDQFIQAFFEKTGIILQAAKDRPVYLELPPNTSFSYLGLECSTLLVLFPDDDYVLCNAYLEVSPDAFFSAFTNLFNSFVSLYGQNYQILQSFYRVEDALNPSVEFQLPILNHFLNEKALKELINSFSGSLATAAIDFDGANLAFYFPLDSTQQNATIHLVYGAQGNADLSSK